MHGKRARAYELVLSPVPRSKECTRKHALGPGREEQECLEH